MIMYSIILWALGAILALFVAWFVGGVYGYRSGMRDGKEEGVRLTLKDPDGMGDWLWCYYARMRKGK